jgi:cyclohexanone monooxygenase
MRTLHGMHGHGFPNCFIMSPAQAGFTANFPHLLNEQSTHIAYIVKTCAESNYRVVEATQDAEDEWVETISRLNRGARKFLESCTPGYYNNEGKPGERNGQNAPFGGGSMAFFALLKEWRAEGNMNGLETR